MLFFRQVLRAPDGDRRARAAKGVERGLEEAMVMLEGMAEHLRLESGRMEAKCEAVPLAGIMAALEQELRESMAESHDWIIGRTTTMPPKAYRWVPEMLEIARTFEDTGMTPRMLLGAADMFELIARTALGSESPETARARGRGGPSAPVARAARTSASSAAAATRVLLDVVDESLRRAAEARRERERKDAEEREIEARAERRREIERVERRDAQRVAEEQEIRTQEIEAHDALLRADEAGAEEALARARDADDDRLPPSAMAAFERLAHHIGVAGAVERIIRAASGQLDHLVDDIPGADLRRIDEIGHAEFLGHLAL